MSGMLVRPEQETWLTRYKPVDYDKSHWISGDPECHFQKLIIKVFELAVLLIEGVGEVHGARSSAAKSEDGPDGLIID
jgi:hypothetical protein